MTAAQRLRLVLALGVINLVLAGVVLAVGIADIQSPPTTAGGPTPGIAFVSPAPTATSTVPEPTAPSPQEPGTSTPGSPAPTSAPTAEPTPEIPVGSPAIEPSPAVEPSPSVEPTPDQPVALAPNPVRAPTAVVVHPNAGRPASTPTPTEATPSPPETPNVDKPGRVHEAKPPKVKHQKHHVHRPKHHGQGGGHQQATVDKSQRGHKSARRLRIHRRTR